MVAGLIQLVSYGMESIFLTGDPQITFFKMIYRKHTIFTKEQMPQNFKQDNINFGKTIDCTISKNGDLMGNIVLSITLPPVNLTPNGISQFAWVKRIGFALIKSISVIINGEEIDKHYGDWLNIWAELTGSINGPKKNGYKKMIGEDDNLTNFSYSKEQYQLFIPLQFWFCRSSGLTLPLVSMQYSDIKIKVELEEIQNCCILSPSHYITCTDDMVSFEQYEYIEQNINGNIRAGLFMNYDIIQKKLYYYKITSLPFENSIYPIIGKTTGYTTFTTGNTVIYINNFNIKSLNLVNVFLIVDYYYLDGDERTRFLKAKHDYIIEQLFFTQQTEIDNITKNVKLTTFNPCKLMIWTLQYKYINNSKDFFNYGNTYQNKQFIYEQYDVPLYYPIGKNITINSTILLNGIERLSFRNNSYFEYVQQLQHTKYSPRVGINMYSYALNPFEPIQPSGTFNTSKIDNIEIKLQLEKSVNINTPVLFKGYCLCVNIFRIINGIGALMFVK